MTPEETSVIVKRALLRVDELMQLTYEAQFNPMKAFSIIWGAVLFHVPFYLLIPRSSSVSLLAVGISFLATVWLLRIVMGPVVNFVMTPESQDRLTNVFFAEDAPEDES